MDNKEFEKYTPELIAKYIDFRLKLKRTWWLGMGFLAGWISRMVVDYFILRSL